MLKESRLPRKYPRSGWCALRGLSRGISEWEKSESPFRQGSFLPKEFSKKSSRQTVTRERVASSGEGMRDEDDGGARDGRKKQGTTVQRRCLRGCYAKEKSPALEKPTCGTLSPETYHRKRSSKLRSIDALNYERTERRTYVVDK